MAKIPIYLILLFILLPILTAHSEELTNPIGPSEMTLIDLLVRIMRILLGGIGFFALAMFLYGGYMMLTSGGNTETIKKAKDTLLWATLGLLVIFASWAITKFLFEVFSTTPL